MAKSFLESYVAAFERIEGWFSRDAALMFMAYNEVAASQGIAGDVLEIGVHHGLSAIGLSAMRGDGARFVAVDLFEQFQQQNISASGQGSRRRFERNMAEFFDDIGFVRCIVGASSALQPADLGGGFAFCHVDGGHTMRETFQDLELGAQILVPGGLLALDDYFNPAYPGVCEGAVKFWLTHDSVLTPIAVGFNKVLFQKEPRLWDLNDAFDRRFPQIPHKTVTLWDTPIHAFSSFADVIDLAASSPRALVTNQSFRMDAVLVPQSADITSRGGVMLHVPVRVVNRSSIPFGVGADAPFGLSYHLMSSTGRDLQFDNVRSYFRQPLEPEEERTVDLAIEVPTAQGSYQVEVDIIWEGITWLKNQGLQTPRIELTVI
jgi:hypothetical protein